MNDEQKFYDHLKTVTDVVMPTSGNIVLTTDIVSDLKLCSRLLFLFIDSDENDVSLVRLADDFHIHLDVILNNKLAMFPQALEGLAQKFESFLKKIGYFRYKNTPEWSGSLTHEGIKSSTLKNLYDGKLEVKRRSPQGTRALFLSTMLFNNVSPLDEITEFLRADMRNAVHISSQYPRRELVKWSEYVLLAYLAVINDNSDFLSEIFLPEVKSKRKLQMHFQKWQNRYVQTLFVEQDRNDLAGLSPQIIETDWNVNDTDSFIPKRGEILDIINDTKHLVIVGDPGLGKTTTLQFIGYQMSLHNNYLPLYFPVKDYISGRSLVEQIAEFSSLDHQSISGFLPPNNVLFLIDGINELLILQDSISFKNQIKVLLRDYSECHFIITSRPSSYKNDFNIPVFELKPLSNDQIEDFIQKNFPSMSAQLIVELHKHKKLKEICRNPLILYFLCILSERSPFHIPTNKGLLIRTFIESILIRENKKNPSFHTYTFLSYLIAIGLQTRKNKRLSFDRLQLVTIIDQIAGKLNPTENRITVIDLIMNAGLLVQNGNQISFSHELYQEYFAAEGLLLEQFDTSEIEFLADWEQPLILYSGLVDNPEVFIGRLSIKNPLLAIKCYEGTVLDNFELRDLIIENAYVLSTNIENIKLASDGFLALAKLDKPDLINKSLEESVFKHGRIVFRSLGQITSVLIRTIDHNYLLNLIKIIIQLNKSFLPTIIRNLQQRPPEQLNDLSDDLLELLKPFIYTELDSSFLVRLIMIVNEDNPEKIDTKKLKKYCLSKSKSGSTVYQQNGGSIWRLIEHFKLYIDDTYITKIIESLTENQGSNHLFIKKIYDKKPELRDLIILKCLSSSNVSCQCTGVYLTIKSNQETLFYNDLINLQVYWDFELIRKIRSIRDENDFHSKILSIYSHQEIINKFHELENLREDIFEVKVMEINSKSVIVKSRKLSMRAVLFNEEKLESTLEKGQSITIKIAFLDYSKSKVYVTQHQEPLLDYYEICGLPQIGAVTYAKIVNKLPESFNVRIHGKYYGIIEDQIPASNINKNNLRVRILKYSRGIYYVEVAEKKAKKLPIDKREFYIDDKARQSDFASTLADALKKKSDNI